ncbi:hypothetical protein KsCSTR_27840 [Candidatus Kuenenia stuttgartiensis]|uniref:Uncharacterized protein n=1 Tax=Kuenenia stuttgartiensis TaxID=174633 RepID=A0A6G7GS66_KUEST|nr:hypothetical protein KsCSTR_27840 [Candidatus Kuenenia stuttgartiensis]
MVETGFKPVSTPESYKTVKRINISTKHSKYAISKDILSCLLRLNL